MPLSALLAISCRSALVVNSVQREPLTVGLGKMTIKVIGDESRAHLASAELELTTSVLTG